MGSRFSGWTNNRGGFKKKDSGPSQTSTHLARHPVYEGRGRRGESTAPCRSPRDARGTDQPCNRPGNTPSTPTTCRWRRRARHRYCHPGASVAPGTCCGDGDRPVMRPRSTGCESWRDTSPDGCSCCRPQECCAVASSILPSLPTATRITSISGYKK